QFAATSVSLARCGVPQKFLCVALMRVAVHLPYNVRYTTYRLNLTSLAKSTDIYLEAFMLSVSNPH
ncbi:MAG: hypothetical protein K5Q00_02245, partial [Gammaproteobacteria bacterium]|nr:hypothetical protein [Gammaproteobacteria bacterium]